MSLEIADTAEIQRLSSLLEEVTATKDGAYKERNLVVALLAEVVTRWSDGRGVVFLAPHVGEDWGPEWKWVLFLDLHRTIDRGLPASGQLSWHLHESELPNFSRVPRINYNPWDGHSTDEKYDRIRRYVGAPVE